MLIKELEDVLVLIKDMPREWQVGYIGAHRDSTIGLVEETPIVTGV